MDFRYDSWNETFLRFRGEIKNRFDAEPWPTGNEIIDDTKIIFLANSIAKLDIFGNG